MSEDTLEYYRDRAFSLQKEKVWLEAELSIARGEAQTERSIRRHVLAMCVAIAISVAVTSAAIATALASPH